jgi:hypothetical protein
MKKGYWLQITYDGASLGLSRGGPKALVLWYVITVPVSVALREEALCWPVGKWVSVSREFYKRLEEIL